MFLSGKFEKFNFVAAFEQKNIVSHFLLPWIIISLSGLFNSFITRCYKPSCIWYYLYIPQKQILVQRWLTGTIYRRAAKETKSRMKSSTTHPSSFGTSIEIT